jgi:hypothetical protein
LKQSRLVVILGQVLVVSSEYQWPPYLVPIVKPAAYERRIANLTNISSTFASRLCSTNSSLRPENCMQYGAGAPPCLLRLVESDAQQFQRWHLLTHLSKSAFDSVLPAGRTKSLAWAGLSTRPGAPSGLVGLVERALPPNAV